MSKCRVPPHPASDDDALGRVSANLFRISSSGHKIVLLTITRLVETVEEKSLGMHWTSLNHICIRHYCQPSCEPYQISWLIGMV